MKKGMEKTLQDFCCNLNIHASMKCRQRHVNQIKVWERKKKQRKVKRKKFLYNMLVQENRAHS